MGADWGYPDEFSQHPAGGFKRSGIGKDMGNNGINEYYKEKRLFGLLTNIEKL